MREWERLEGTTGPYTPHSFQRRQHRSTVMLCSLQTQTCHHWTWQATGWPRQPRELLMKSRWILERSLQGAEGRPDWTVSQFFFPQIYNSGSVRIQHLKIFVQTPTQARREHAESTGLPSLLLPPHLPIQASVHTLIVPLSCFNEVKMSETGDSSNRFLSPHPAHIKRNQKEGGAICKINKQLTLTIESQRLSFGEGGEWQLGRNSLTREN